MAQAISTVRRLFMEPIASDGACSPQEVSARDPSAHAAEWGQKPYAVSFRYFEQDVVTIGDRTVLGDKTYDPGQYYLGTMRSVHEHAPEIDNAWMRDNFLANARDQGFTHVAVMPSGRTSALRADDAVVSMAGVVARVRDLPADTTLRI